MANEDLSIEEDAAHQQCVDGGNIGGNIMGGRITAAARKLLANEPLSDEEAVAHQINVDGGTAIGGRFASAKQKSDNNKPLSIEETAARQANVDGGTTAGGMKRKAMFADGAVGVWLNCGECRHEKECGIYPKGHEMHVREEGKRYKPRQHGCPNCRKNCSFYTEEELEVRRKHRQENGGTYWRCSFDYGLLNSL